MIGILPAAGNATRMIGLPKALLPINGTTLIGRHVALMQAVGPHRIAIGSKGATFQLLDAMFGDDTLMYRADTETMSQTVLAARHYAYDAEMTMLGLPDTYVEDDLAYIRLSNALLKGADVAVGLFVARPEQRHKLGMCMVEQGQVTEVRDKPEHTTMIYAWGVLAWKQKFWEFIQPDDPHVGYALPRAIAAGLNVEAVRMLGGFWDAGTYTEYSDLIFHLKQEVEKST